MSAPTADVPAADVPVGSGTGSQDEDETGGMPAIVERLMRRVAELEARGEREKDPNKLKPIDIKDIEKPDKYDGNIKNFNVWYERLKDLLMNRHPNWEYVLDEIERAGSKQISDGTKFFTTVQGPSEDVRTSLAEQAGVYQQQLKAYLRTYTAGELYARITHTHAKDSAELLREIIAKGKIGIPIDSLISRLRRSARRKRARPRI